jgi:hypothetical protein
MPQILAPAAGAKQGGEQARCEEQQPNVHKIKSCINMQPGLTEAEQMF